MVTVLEDGVRCWCAAAGFSAPGLPGGSGIGDIDGEVIWGSQLFQWA